MAIVRTDPEELVAAIEGRATGGLWSQPGTSDVVVVDLDQIGDGEESESGPTEEATNPNRPPLHPGITVVVVGETTAPVPEEHRCALLCDVVVSAGEPMLEVIASRVRENPIASVAFVQVLRGASQRSVSDGLLLESVTYSTLQAGPEFSRWRASRPNRPVRRSSSDPVLMQRCDGRLDITLDRPEVRNALDTAMRDQLLEAFLLPASDPTILEVHLWGAGSDFCAGGDLDEFGSFPDPATAHLVRTHQSIGRSIHAVSARTTAHVHGACMGSGIELPAFAGHLVARPGTSFSLPEVSLGLIPGAGGTVSIMRRIGAHRTARLGLTGERIDAETALRWGLVDQVDADGR